MKYRLEVVLELGAGLEGTEEVWLEQMEQLAGEADLGDDHSVRIVTMGISRIEEPIVERTPSEHQNDWVLNGL